MITGTYSPIEYGWDYPPGMTSSDVARMLGDAPIFCGHCEHKIVGSNECTEDACWESSAPWAVDHCDKCCPRHDRGEV